MAISERDYDVYISNVPNRKNEDRFSESSPKIRGADITILGVYDGHGGKHCAEYISKTLPQTIALDLTNNDNTPVAKHIESSFKEVDDCLIQKLRDNFKSILSWPIPRSVRQKAIDSKLKNEDVKEIALRARSGSTALVAVIEKDCITFGNVGDCRAVLGHNASLDSQVEAKALTVDHNGDTETERRRVLSEHPPSEAKTLFAGGRLFGHTAITRSFGDVFFKEPNTAYTEHVFSSADFASPEHLPYNQSMARFYPLIKTPPYLTAMPDITKHQRSHNDRFLIIASDGVWGLQDATDEWAVRIVQEGLEKGVDPSKYMMEEVQKFKPGDDVTIIVVVFKARQ